MTAARDVDGLGERTASAGQRGRSRQTAAAVEAAEEAAFRSSDTPRPPRVRRRNLGALPAHLPRVEVLVDVADTSCPCCGGTLHVIARTRARCSTSCRPSCG